MEVRRPFGANTQRRRLNQFMERNLGEQPLSRILAEHNLKSGDLVAASTENITYKMVSRACTGRRLTPHVQVKICNALNKATGKTFSLTDLFNY